MKTQADVLKARTKQFALRVIRVVRSLPSSLEGRIMARQLLRSGTSVAANYRAVCRARSRQEFLAKLSVVIEEADQLAAIFNASRTTAKKGVQSTINNQKSTILDKRAS